MTAIDVSRRIEDQHRGSFIPKFIVLAAFLTFFDGFDLNAIAYVAPSLIRQWHIDKLAFSPVFSAGLIGMLAGSVAVGFVSDRYGRKPAAVASTLAAGLFTLCSLFATNLSELTVLRFLTGFGLGGILPMVFTMAVEFVPTRLRATAVTLALIGFNVGSMLGGVLAATLIPRFGWTIIYWIGGLAPLVIVGVMSSVLPESVRFLVNKARPTHQITAALRHIDSTFVLPSGARFVDSSDLLGHGATSLGATVRMLFAGRLRLVTPLLWVTFFCVGTVLFVTLSWTPTLGESEGLMPGSAALALTAFSFGTMSAGLVSMRALDWWGAAVLPLFAAAACPVLLVLGLVRPSDLGFVALLFLVGLTIGGGFNALNALCGLFYPTSCRGAGVSWAVAASRVGGVVGPVLVGLLLARHVSVRGIYLWAVVPAVLFTVSAIALSWFGKTTKGAKRSTAGVAAEADILAVPVGVPEPKLL